MNIERSASAHGEAIHPGLAYRPEIDGLRAIAVLAVVIYHAVPSWLPGGFVGVDVFFVISGYLITSLLVAEHAASGRIDLAGFYARRVRRLMPALWLVLAAVLVVATFVLGPLGVPVRAVADSTLASLAFVANGYFLMHAGDYFAGPVDEMPLLHLWSLAVEEQFYLVYPLLLMLLLGRGRRSLVGVIAVLSLASLAMAEFWVGVDPSLAFYLMPARFWELAAGGLVALCVLRAPNGLWPAWLAAAGIAIVLAACWTTPGDGRFPGFAALPAVAGAAMLLFAVHAGGPLGPAGALLASRPAVGIGLVSYALYLWHWPLLAIDRALRLEDSTPGWRLLLCVFAFALAMASLYLVERPGRRLRMPRRPLFIVAAAISALIAGGSWALARSQPLPSELAALVSKTRDDAPTNWRQCHIPVRAQVARLRLAECLSAPGATPRVGLWGDSHALAWQPFAWRLAEADRVAAINLTMNSCTPIPGYDGRRSDVAAFAENCARFNRLALDWLASAGLDTVIIASRWPAAYPGSDDDGSPQRPRTAGTLSLEGLAAGLDASLSELSHVPRVLLMGPVPELRREAATCIARGQAHVCGYTRRQFEQAVAPSRRLLAALAARHPNVTLIDPAGFFCDAARCQVMRDGHSLYWDDDHVSATAARAFADAYRSDPARYTAAESRPPR